MTKNLNIPKHLKGMDFVRYLAQNKEALIAEKKYLGMKEADPCGFYGSIVGKTGEVTKSGVGIIKEEGVIHNSTVINTCLWFDSHDDVSLPGSWNKTISDNAKRAVNGIRLLQEHKRSFSTVIADKSDVLPYVADLSWKQLGLDIAGQTEAVVFDNVIRHKRNPFMYDQYKDGHVDNHSAGLFYVDIALAIHEQDKEFEAENKLWNEFASRIPNIEEAKAIGYFWGIKQQRLDEGSSVLDGSNKITPTFSQSFKSTLNEPVKTTQGEPQTVKSWFSQIQ